MQKRYLVCLLCLLLLGVFAWLFVSPLHVKAAPQVSCNGTWQIVPSPNVANAANALLGVSATSASDGWAVGYDYVSGPTVPLIEHWNGSSWSIVPGPQPYDGELRGVSAVSSTSAWAVGFYIDQKTSTHHSLIEHWNGSRWSMIPHPEPAGVPEFFAVAALSDTNVWAVGTYTGNGWQALIEHWNGQQWTIVKSPSGSAYYNSFLFGISAVSSTNIWAVGYAEPNNEITLVEHWNGTSWSIIPSPNSSRGLDHLNGVTALSSTNVWAVGSVIEHWNGRVWSIVSAPQLNGEPNSVTAISSTNIWAAGQTTTLYGLTAHWNGSSWNQVANPSPYTTYLNAITPTAGQYVWAVGYVGDSSGGTTFIEKYC